MGMMRKFASASTLGMVNYRSKGERQSVAALKAAKADQKVAKEQSKLLKAERKALENR